MLAHLLNLRIVPAAPEVVPGVVVGRVGHPLGVDLTGRLRLGEVDEDLLPVGLVVVGPEEAAPPVVEWVEEPVLQHHPAVLAGYPAVVAVVLALLGHYALVGDRGRGCGLPRHPPPGKQRDRVEGVHEAGDVPDAREPAPPGSEGLTRLPKPPGRAPAEHPYTPTAGSRPREVPGIGELEKVDRPGLVEGLLREPLQVQLPLGHDADGFLSRPLHPQGAGAYVRLDVHREELVPPGQADDGLETPEQGFGLVVLGVLDVHAAPPGSCWVEARSRWSTTRTSWELR